MRVSSGGGGSRVPINGPWREHSLAPIRARPIRVLPVNLPRLVSVTSDNTGPEADPEVEPVADRGTDRDGNPVGRSLARRSVSALAVAGLAFFVPLLFFVLLAEDVAEQEIFPFDRPVMLWLHSVSTPSLTAVMEAVTLLGGIVVVPVAATGAAVALWCRGSRRNATLLTAAVVGSTLLNTALKSVFQRSRPDFWEHLVTENSYSFPSGHAMASMALAASLVVLGWGTRWRWSAVVAGAVYVLAVGISRMYLGVHYPSDVIAGWCVSVLWVAVVVVVLDRIVTDRVEAWHHRRGGGTDRLARTPRRER